MDNNVVNKKYLRIPDFIFQAPPPNYITAVGRNALGLNKKKLTFEDIEKLKLNSRNKAEANKKTKISPGVEATSEVFDSLEGIPVKRSFKTQDNTDAEEKETKKQKTLISEEDWMNIPEAKKLTKTISSKANNETLVINKFNSLENSMGKGDDNLALVNEVNWKQKIKETEKSEANYKKLLQKSLRKVLQDPTVDNLNFQLDLLNECVIFLVEEKTFFTSQLDSILRYSKDKDVWRNSFALLETLRVNSYEKTAFLNNYLSKNKDSYKEAGWAVHKLYLIGLNEYADTDDNYLIKKMELSKLLSTYGTDIIELLYESCRLESDNVEKVQELVSFLPLNEWEIYLNEVYQNKDVDTFLMAIIDIVIKRRYNKGNLGNLQNLMNKFSNPKIKYYILTQIASLDCSLNIWEHYFNYELLNHTRVVDVADFLDSQISKGEGSFDFILELFMQKFFYYNVSKSDQDIQMLLEFLKRNEKLATFALFERLKMERELGSISRDKLLCFNAFKDKNGRFVEVKYELEFVKWHIALQEDFSKITGLFESLLTKHNDRNVLYHSYCDYLLKTENQKELHRVVTKGLEKFPLDSALIDYLFTAECSISELAKLKVNYNKLWEESLGKQICALYLLQKIFYREAMADLSNPLNLTKINRFLQKYKISASFVKSNPQFGLIISLQLRLEFQSADPNNKSAVKSVIKKYLTQFDNNFIVMYELAFLLKDCKWLLNSIKKNFKFQNPYELLLDSGSRVCSFKGYEHVHNVLVASSMYPVHLPTESIQELVPLGSI